MSGVHLVYEVCCDESDSFVINAKLLVKIPETLDAFKIKTTLPHIFP